MHNPSWGASAQARAAGAAALPVLLLAATLAPLAASAPHPLAFDFAGNGAVEDLGGFGVAASEFEVTLWGASGIAAGPMLVAAGPRGAYNWSFPQAPQTGLLNLTMRAWLPWDASVSVEAVFDVSNGTPRTNYAGLNLTLPFAATETVQLALPTGELILPRGRAINVSFEFVNTGNVSVLHQGYRLAPSSANVTAALQGPAPTETGERPGSNFGFNASLGAGASAGLENGTVTAEVASASGTNFSFALVLRIVPNRDVASLNVTTAPSPPDEARPGDVLVSVANHGLDDALAVDVRVRVLNATVSDLYSNTTQADLPAGTTALLRFAWTAPWSPDPLTAVATVTVAFDFDPSDDSAVAVFSVNATNLPPTVSFSTPAQGARLAGNVTVAGSADDPEGGSVTLSFAVDSGAPFMTGSGPAFAFVWDLGLLPDGPHRLAVLATDERGYTTNAGLDVVVLNRGPNAAPTVTLSSPRDGDTVGASVGLSGSASDERGELTAVFVAFDGGPESTASGTAAWSFAWNPGSAGVHELRVRAFDGIDSSAPVFANLTVNLTPPTGLALRNLTINPPVAIPGSFVVLSGTAVLDTGEFAAGAAVSGEIRQFPGLVNTVADVRGDFSLNLTAPGATGDFLVDVAADARGVRGNATLSLTVSTSTLPDLQVLPSGIALTPDPPPANTVIHHSIVISNSGSGEANATLRVWDGPASSGVLLYEWRFNVRTTRQAGFDHAYSPGTHNLTLAVQDVDPQDANASDNTLVYAVVIADAPDFVVESIAPSTSPIVAGANISFLVVVRNDASARGIVQVELWDGPPSRTGSVLFYQEQLNISGNSRDRVVGNWTPTAGEHRIFAYALIPYNPGLETDLTDNERNITVSVAAPQTPAPPAFLPGFGAILGLSAIASATLTARRARSGRRPRKRTGPLLAALLVAAALGAAFLPAPTSASLEDADRVPGPLNGVCQTCHVNPDRGGPLNSFGVDYWAARNASSGNVDWQALGELDSDGDGFRNSDEWNGSYLPGDPGSNPRTGVKYAGFTAAGVSSLLVGLAVILVMSAMGAWLGFRMLNKRNARRAQKDAVAAGKDTHDASAPLTPKP